MTDIAVLIPCYNEEKTIAKVVSDFKRVLPEARIYVFDNNSSDQTVEQAKNAGALVRHENRQGKGHVVQTMFRIIDADIFILVDGDDTYPAECARLLLEPVLNDEADMVVGSRISRGSESEFHLLNLLGNKIYLFMITWIFNAQLQDILSGYRCMNREFVKTLPLFLKGFEVETELTIKALERGFRIREIPIHLGHRPPGSHSKIHIIRDGFKILRTILSLSRDYKPLTVFGSLGLFAILIGLIPGAVAVNEYFHTGLVLHFPSAILSVGIILTGMLMIGVGLILHTINRRIQEVEHNLRILTNAAFQKYNKRDDSHLY